MAVAAPATGAEGAAGPVTVLVTAAARVDGDVAPAGLAVAVAEGGHGGRWVPGAGRGCGDLQMSVFQVVVVVLIVVVVVVE